MQTTMDYTKLYGFCLCVLIIIKLCDAEALLNVALKKNGATCTASSSYDGGWLCYKAIDGNYYGNGWASSAQGTKSWIKIAFKQAYEIYKVKLTNRRYYRGRDEVKEAEVDFNDGKAPIKVSFSGVFTRSEKALNPPRKASGVKIRVTKTGTGFNNNPGFQEIEIFDGGCPNGFTRYQSSCYKLIRARHTWPDAKQICSDIGGEMVLIDNSNENKWVRDFASSKGETDYIWLNVNDLAAEGRWMTNPRTPAYFTYWETGEPNNHNKYDHHYKGEDAAGMRSNGKWNDLPSVYKYPTVCKTPRG